MDTNRVRDEYRSTVAHTLAGFQLVEEALKTYLQVYYDIVRRFLPSGMKFGHERKDVDGLALGKLITLFGKYSANDALVSELSSVKGIRDDLAHKALAHLYGGDDDPDDMRAKTQRFSDVATRLAGLMRRVQEESLALVDLAERSESVKAVE